MNAILLNLHILGSGFSLAVLVFSAVFLFQRSISNERLDNIRILAKAGAIALVWLVITGAGLFTERSQDSTSTILFWVKVGLLVTDIIFGFVLLNKKLKSLKSIEQSRVGRPNSIFAWVIFNIVVVVIISVLSLNISK